MILDNSLMIANALAHGGTPTVIDLGSKAGKGKGEPIRLFVQGSADLAGATGFVVTDGATDTAGDALATVVTTLAGNTVEFILPIDVARYVKVALTGTTSAGSWSCGVCAEPIQSNS